jgi:allophanate hydrolase subunit 2
MDRFHASLATQMLANSPDSPLLEIAYGGTKFKVQGELVIAIAGASESVILNGKSIKTPKILSLTDQDLLDIPFARCGVYTYIALQGGFNTEKVMNSYSCMKHITAVDRLQKGDAIESLESILDLTNQRSVIKRNLKFFNNNKIDVFEGPEFDSAVFNQGYLFQISSTSNRQAYLLTSTLNDIAFKECITSAVMPGTVQLTRSGQFNVLMRDCQTTGGYPRILQLPEYSINQLAQKQAGELIEFRLID